MTASCKHSLKRLLLAVKESLVKMFLSSFSEESLTWAGKFLGCIIIYMYLQVVPERGQMFHSAERRPA